MPVLRATVAGGWHFPGIFQELGEGGFKLSNRRTLSLLFPATFPLFVSVHTSWKTLKYLLMLGMLKARFLKANQLVCKEGVNLPSGWCKDLFQKFFLPESSPSVLLSLFSVFDSVVETEKWS